MKTVYKWKSGIAEAAQKYISLKQQTGMKFESQERYLRHFDTFYYRNGFEGSTLTKEIVNDFIYDPNERPVSHHNKEVLMRDFAIYLAGQRPPCICGGSQNEAATLQICSPHTHG